ncbi:MAG TPA: hypothetical protein VN428_09545 [Bryobacteraceae bacterium]|nr:hypothetical protein [Bryobacteraceae bacterium]
MLIRLIQLIESHWDLLTDRIIRKIRQDPRLQQIGSLPESDLRDKSRDIIEHLGHWLSVRDETKVAQRFERIGAHRFAEGVPLAEVILSYIIIKDSVLDFVRSQGLDVNAMELWAEEELQRDVGHFFDSVIYHLIRGYANARENRGVRTA